VRTGGGELERELALRPNVRNELELDLEGGVFVMGRVVDSGGEGIPRAEVRLDGAPVACDGLGRFQGSTGAGGRSWIEVTCAGYAPTRLELAPPRAVPDGLAPLPEPLEIVLAPACRLEVELELAGAHADPPRILVIPDRGLRALPGSGGYPWSRLGALVAPDGRLVLEDLPPGDVQVLAFHESARERSVSLRLDPRQTAQVTLRLRPSASDDVEVAHETLDPLGKWLLALGGDVSEVFTRPLEGL